jgi:hypothetical protein
MLDEKFCGEHLQDDLIKVCNIPIKVLRCWMRNELYDNIENVEMPTTHDPENLQYGLVKYPVWLYKLIRSYGNQAFKVFYEAGFMDEATYQLVSARNSELDEWRESQFASSEDPDGTEGEELGDSATSYAGSTPPRATSEHDNVSATTSYQVAAVQIPMADRERLRKIGEIHVPLSDAQWAQLLGFEGKSSAFNFIKRMEQEGLVTRTGSSPTEGGIIRLTEKGRRILAAFG